MRIVANKLRCSSVLVFAAITAIGWPACTVLAVEFNEIARFSLGILNDPFLDEEETMPNPNFLSNGLNGVAWNGSKLYVAGYDNGASVAGVGLIEVLDASTTGIVENPTFSSRFGLLFPDTPNRGYTGLAISGGLLAASYDGGSDNASGIQVFDTSDNTLVWDLSAAGLVDRGSSGVAFDPGFPGGDVSQGTGVAWTTFGSGRRILQDAATGATIHDITTGFPWRPNEPGGNEFPRDLAFDPDTGDIYVRRNNDVIAADRNGDNTVQNQRKIVDNNNNGEFQVGQHIEFLSGTPDGDFVIYNDRPAPNAFGLPFVDHVKLIDPDGNPQTANFNLIGGGTGADIADGNAIYDFAYDPGTNTLALLDFVNFNVFIFQVGDVPATLAGDFNDDGVVDAADYTVWRDALGASIALPNETASPGIVDQADYEAWRDNFGAVAGTGALTAAAVPEPGTWLLLSGAAGFCLAVRLRRRL